MSFFLFSFHVHEKTILVPSLAFLLCFSFKLIRNASKSFFLICLFSLYPLLKRENQHIPYIISMLFIYFFSKMIFNFFQNLKKDYKKEINPINYFSKFIIIFLDKLEYIDIIFIIINHICEKLIPPPEKYPWLYPLINSSFAFAHFILFYMIANIKLYLLIRK